jgi:hypothetical protein
MTQQVAACGKRVVRLVCVVGNDFQPVAKPKCVETSYTLIFPQTAPESSATLRTRPMNLSNVFVAVTEPSYSIQNAPASIEHKIDNQC